jgi:hypothetical protein
LRRAQCLRRREGKRSRRIAIGRRRE